MDYHFEKAKGMLVLYCYKEYFKEYDYRLFLKGYHLIRDGEAGGLLKLSFIEKYGEEWDYSGTYCKHKEIEDEISNKEFDDRVRKIHLSFIKKTDDTTSQEKS